MRKLDSALPSIAPAIRDGDIFQFNVHARPATPQFHSSLKSTVQPGRMKAAGSYGRFAQSSMSVSFA